MVSPHSPPLGPVGRPNWTSRDTTCGAPSPPKRSQGLDRQRIGQARIARLAAGLRQTTKALSAHAAVLDCPNMRKRSALIG